MKSHDEHISFDFFDGTTAEDFYVDTPCIVQLGQSQEETTSFAGEDNFDEFDEVFGDIDFSNMQGNFRQNLKQTVAQTRAAKPRPQTRPKPLSKTIPVQQRADIRARQKGISKVIVPDSKKVIVEGVSKFILSKNQADNWVKNIGYKDGKKLKELIITFNNDSALDFEIELFNPSTPLDYLYSTSLNINDKITVAGGTTSYTDVLHNLQSNPARIYASKFVVAGPSASQQINQPLEIINKNIAGEQKIESYQIPLDIDLLQMQNNIIYFNLEHTLNRPYIPDGMDVLKYKVLAGMTVTFGFYYSQISLKKFFYPEANAIKTLM